MAPNWSSLCIPAFLVVGLLENINSLSSGGLVNCERSQTLEHDEKASKPRQETGTEYRYHWAIIADRVSSGAELVGLATPTVRKPPLL